MNFISLSLEVKLSSFSPNSLRKANIFFPYREHNFILDLTNLILLQILWLRHRDLHLLTTGVHTYSRDKRFSAVHRFPGNDWVLRIQQTRINDTGIYQCQVATTPPVGITFHLSVVGKPFTQL